MGFAAALWASLQKDLPLIYPQLLMLVAATVMLWPADAFVAKDAKGQWAAVTVIVLVAAVYFMRR